MILRLFIAVALPEAEVGRNSLRIGVVFSLKKWGRAVRWGACIEQIGVCSMRDTNPRSNVEH